MSDEAVPGLSERYHKTSAWPLFVALGLVVSEVGVVLGIYALTVAGLVLFGGAVAGILSETEYVSRPAVALGAIGGILVIGGTLVGGAQLGIDGLTLSALVDRTHPIVYRASAILTAGLTLVAMAVAGVISSPR